MGEAKKIRVGVIGAGSIAKVAHFPVMASMPEIEISAVFSRTFERAEDLSRQFGARKTVRTIE
jgi:predicted dehydrogenase